MVIIIFDMTGCLFSLLVNYPLCAWNNRLPTTGSAGYEHGLSRLHGIAHKEAGGGGERDVWTRESRKEEEGEEGREGERERSRQRDMEEGREIGRQGGREGEI